MLPQLRFFNIQFERAESDYLWRSGHPEEVLSFRQKLCSPIFM
jgi:hypothetical protein